MKNALYLLLLIPLTFLLSCSTDIDSVENEELIEEPEKTAEVLAIEYNTLASINEALVAIDIEPYSLSEMESRRSVRSERTCLNATFKGDINEDDLISIEDVTDIFSIIKEYDNKDRYPEKANGDGKLHVNSEYTGTIPSFWSVAHVAQLVTYDEGGSLETYLDRYDAAVIIDLIIDQCN